MYAYADLTKVYLYSMDLNQIIILLKLLKRRELNSWQNETVLSNKIPNRWGNSHYNTKMGSKCWIN